jgi:hypothetical protein
MTEIAKSPDRNSFQKNAYIKRVLEEGKSLDDPGVKKMLEFYDSFNQIDEEWVDEDHSNDMEWDMRTCPWFVAKVRASKAYAQNVYAAMCNMRWIKAEVVPILKEEYWSASWRSAGGIVADLRGEGDYIDWYCSGMGGLNQEYDSKETNEDWQSRTGFVPESVVTPEVAADLRALGWIPSEWPED